MEEILKNLKTTQLLRISCSDIAGVTGFNPWSKLDELFEKYLYQDLDELMMQDAENLDSEFLTAEQEIQKILQKIDAKDKQELEALDSVTKDPTVLNCHVKAEDMLKQIQQLMREGGVVSKLSTTELKFMENEFRGRVRKNYGIHCENKALDKYEQIIGFPVVERNMETVKMKVMPLSADEDKKPMSRTATSSSSTMGSQSEETDDCAPVDAFAVLINGSKRLSKEQALAAQGGVKKRRTVVRPSFVLVGRVDGISYQLDMSSDDPAQWTRANKVVVEMKNRVRGISSPPPLYEQIQLVAYMVMLDCPYGDLVQARTRNDGEVPHGSVASTTVATVTTVETVSEVCAARVTVCAMTESSMCTTQESASSAKLDICTVDSFLCNASVSVKEERTAHTAVHTASTSSCATVASMVPCANTVSITTATSTVQGTYKPKVKKQDPTLLYGEEDYQVNRIHLDGPPYHHRKYWDNVVMPRLRLFRDAVAVMRSDDSLRYAYLMSGPEEKVKILQNLCPYIDV